MKTILRCRCLNILRRKKDFAPHRDAGATIAEAAILLPVILGLLLGLVDLSMLFWASHVIDDATTVGARKASMVIFYNGAGINQIQTSITDILDTYPVIEDIQIGIMNPPSNIDGDGIPDIIASVSVRATYRWMFLGALGIQPAVIERTVKRRWEWQGTAAVV